MSRPSGSSPTGPLTRYLELEAAGGRLLAIATILALALASSSGADAYAGWLAWSCSFALGDWLVAISVREVIDEGLMTLFFFSVGLELRRELHAGELSEPRRAALPAVAALGGMVVPALLYLALDPAGPAQRGWAVSMATDIAFAVAVLALLGRRVAPALRVLLLALAVLTNVGGVVVVATAYSESIVPRGLVVTAIGVVLALGMRDSGVRSPWAYVVPGVVAWLGLRHAGVHPTMAGLMMGLITPPQDAFGRSLGASGSAASLRSPSEKVQAAIHPWVVFIVMPLFAFANAGVVLDVSQADPLLVAGVVVGLVVGKPLGILGATWIALRLRLVRLPVGVDWQGLTVVGLVAGVGFTVALFIAGLAFGDPGVLASAKLGILGGSALAMALALVVGWLVLPRTPVAGAAATVEEAERALER